MEKHNFLNQIRNVIDDFVYSPSLYALLSEDGSFQLKRINMDERLENGVKEIADSWLNAEILSNEFDLQDVASIDENQKTFYGLESYSSNIRFPTLSTSSKSSFSEEDQLNLIGLLVYINKDDKGFWLYQHVYKITQMNRKNFLYAVLNGESCYSAIDKDIFRINHNFDFVIFDDYLAAKNWKLMQLYFGFEDYIRTEAGKYVDGIERMAFVSNLSKLKECCRDIKIAKKLMKLKGSSVLQINGQDLLSRIASHSVYAGKFKKDSISGRLIIDSKNAVNNLLKMLNDEILHSELTENDYESKSKMRIS